MQCPLCLKECIAVEEANLLPVSYACAMKVEINKGDFRPHFQRYVTGNWSDGLRYAEVAIILPYRLVNYYDKFTEGTVYSDEQEKKRVKHEPHSTIWSLKEAQQFSFGMMSFDKILELPLIHMDIEEKLLERIKLMVLMS